MLFHRSHACDEVDTLPAEPPPALRQASVRSDGVHVVVECPKHCGPREITIEWDEVSAIANGVSPHSVVKGQTEWRLMPKGWCPLGLQCSGCGATLSVYVTSETARAYSRSGAEQYFRKWRHGGT
jgi:hypothetical protein